MIASRQLVALCAVWLLSLALYFLLPDSSSAVATNEVAQFDQALPKTSLARPPYADWIHDHWVRLAPRATESDVLAAIREYQKMGVPIDAVILQFWENPQQIFQPDAALFPDFRKFVGLLHKLNVRVVLTVDAGLPKGSSHYVTGVAKGFLLDDGRTVKINNVEKGLVDYTNPEAVKWIHSLLHNLFDFKIDGVKVTALDGYFLEQWPISGVKSFRGRVDAESWGQLYYYDMFDYGREVSGFDFVSMFRPVDTFAGFQYHSFGPQDISFAGWVGDHAISVEGMRESLLNAIHSANRGFVCFGVSVGGSAAATPAKALPQSLVQHQELFTRWTQLAAFLPLMENGGQGENHYPWAIHGVRSETVLNAYREYAVIHKELRPLFYALASVAHAEYMRKSGRVGGDDAPWTRVFQPLTQKRDFLSEPDSWDFLVGADLFVAPILALETSPTGNNALKLEQLVSQRNVTFPSFGQWIPYKYDRQQKGFFPPKATVELSAGISEYLVFKRRGSVIPLHVTSGISGHGAPESSEATTFVIDRPYLLKKRVNQKAVPKGLQLPDDEGLEFTYVFQEHGHGLAVYYTTAPADGNPSAFSMHLRVTPFVKPVIVAIRGIRCVLQDVAKCSNMLRSSGYHPYTEKTAFFSHAIRVQGLRAFLVTEDEMWLYDPFASIGNDIILGPLMSA